MSLTKERDFIWHSVSRYVSDAHLILYYEGSYCV